MTRQQLARRAPSGLWCLVALTIAALALPGTLAAQVLYGSIVGNVRDTTGASIPGATVVITHDETGLTREMVSGEAGAYNFTNVLQGAYTVRVTLPGFREYVNEGVPVRVGQVSRVDVTLEIGALTETVTVQSEALLLQTDTAQVQSELKATEITNLPLSNYRNYQSLVDLTPGATPSRFQNAVIDSPARALTTNVNGTPRNNNNQRLDGTSNIFVWLPHHAAYIAPAESVDTVNITTSNFDAEQGMAGGAAVTVVTKSGTNDLRGSGFWLHDNNRFKSLNFFMPAGTELPDGSRNIAGGTVGGPISRDNVFFFGSYEGTFERVARLQNSTVPIEAFRQGDFSSVNTIIYDPLTGNPDGTGRTPFPDNRIPENRLSPQALTMLGLIPLPTDPTRLTSNHFNQSIQQLDRHQVDVKVNWNRSAAHQIWAKYGRMDALVSCDFALGVLGGGGGLCDTGAGEGDTLVNIATVGHTWTFGTNLVMDGTVGFNNMDQTVLTPDATEPFGLNLLGIPGTNGDDPRMWGMPSFGITGFTAMGNNLGWTPIFREDNSWTANTNFTWLRNRHEMRFGVDVVRHSLNHWQPELGAGPRGHFVFGGGVTALSGGAAPDTYNSLAAFMLGMPTLMQKSIQHELMTAREWQYALYFRDRWQATQNLTLSLGLRMEQYPLMRRADRGIELMDYNTMEVLLGGRGGNPEDLVKVKYPPVVPRLGAAYRLNDDTVLRAGYGITIDPMPFARPLRGFYPLTIAQDFAGPNPFQPFRTLAEGIPEFTGPDLNQARVPLPPTALMRAPRPEINRGHIHSWNVTFERKLPLDLIGSVGYVATAVRNQLGDININAAGVGEGQQGRPFFAQFGHTANLLDWDGQFRGNYHSLQVAVNRPFLRGLLIKSAYTLSRARNETDDSGWAGVSWNHPNEQHRNYALAGHDRTHIFQLGFVAELPFGRDGQGGALSPIIRDWQLNGIVSAYSGQPFTVGASGASVNAPGNAQTADLVGTPTRTGSVQAGQPFYDPSAWAPVTEVRFGTSGRNSVRGPGNRNVDLSVFRHFPLANRARLEARVEVFNLFNSPVFNNPVSSVAAANFMHVTSSQQVFDRQVRFGGRFSF